MLEIIDKLQKRISLKREKDINMEKHLRKRKRLVLSFFLLLLVFLIFTLLVNFLLFLINLLITSSNLIYKDEIAYYLTFFIEYSAALYLVLNLFLFFRKQRAVDIKIFKESYKNYLMESKFWPMFLKISIAIIIILSSVLIIVMIVSGLSFGVFLNLLFRKVPIYSGFLISIFTFLFSILLIYYIYRFVRNLKPIKKRFIVINLFLIVLSFGLFFFETLNFKLKQDFPSEVRVVTKTFIYDSDEVEKIYLKKPFDVEKNNKNISLEIRYFDIYDLQVDSRFLKQSLNFDINLVESRKTKKQKLKLVIEGFSKKMFYDFDLLKQKEVLVKVSNKLKDKVYDK